MISDLVELIEKFDIWYKNDEHSTNEDYYKDKINKNYLQNLNRDAFIDFFFQFKVEGGKLQSGGERSKNKFKKMVENNYESFHDYVLEPFDNNFNLSNWLTKINIYKYFGEGAATIFLNRVDKQRYCVVNNKTDDALALFGIKLKVRITESYYQVLHFQKDLIGKYPILNNFYKADALNHYIIAINEGKELIERLRRSTQSILSPAQPATSINDIMLLKKKKQIILYGPPGTGKTFHTKQIAVDLLGNISKYKNSVIQKNDEASLPLDGAKVWIFQGNPNKYDIVGALSDPNYNIDSWTVLQSKHQIKRGDIALLWMAGDKAGIYALCEIVSDPMMIKASYDKYWNDSEKNVNRLGVKINLIKNLVNNPIFREEIKSTSGLENLTILKFANATNFMVKNNEWLIIKKLIDTRAGKSI